MSSLGNPFNRVKWSEDRIEINDVVFRLQLGRDDAECELVDNCFVLYKGHYMLRQYENLFTRNPQLHFDNVLELGIYECGSVAFWNELLQPSKISALDLRPPYSTDYAAKYFGRKIHVQQYWNTDQADSVRLREIVSNDFGGRVDLVIDDASHFFAPSVKSFETLFPHVKPGGAYVIEDWNWGQLPALQDPSHPWANERSPIELVFEIMEALGSGTLGVDHVESCKAFFVLFRDDSALPVDFSIKEAIVRRPNTTYYWFAS